MIGDKRLFFEILLLVIVPLVLASIEIFHPANLHSHVFGALDVHAKQWLVIHYIQSFLFGLMALALYYLTRKDRSFLAWVVRIFIFIFLITYTVMDAVAGIAVGRLLLYPTAYNLDSDCIKSVVQYLFNDPIVGGIGSVYSLTGSLTWLVAVVLTVLLLAIKSWSHYFAQIVPPLLLLTISGISLYISHAAPYGPIAFGAFALSAIWLLIIRGRNRQGQEFLF
jgi:hypothetical protein